MKTQPKLPILDSLLFNESIATLPAISQKLQETKEQNAKLTQELDDYKPVSIKSKSYYISILKSLFSPQNPIIQEKELKIRNLEKTLEGAASQMAILNERKSLLEFQHKAIMEDLEKLKEKLDETEKYAEESVKMLETSDPKVEDLAAWYKFSSDLLLGSLNIKSIRLLNGSDLVVEFNPEGFNKLANSTVNLSLSMKEHTTTSRSISAQVRRGGMNVLISDDYNKKNSPPPSP